MSKYGKGAWIFGVMAKTIYGHWSSHPCLVGVADSHAAELLIIKAEKCQYYMQRDDK